jgi:hypothetical protein
MKVYFEIWSVLTSKRGEGGPFITPHIDITIGVLETRTSPDGIILNSNGNE